MVPGPPGRDQHVALPIRCKGRPGGAQATAPIVSPKQISGFAVNPDRPDSFAFVANGQAFVKSEAVLRIARELPRWQWTWLFHFIPRVIRDAIYNLVARNRYRWFGRRDTCILPNSDRSW